ncbi:ferritin Dps family protein [Alcaligenes sp. WGS1538]|uniref:ferritin Dps family protein n=1 Tax=Alcaligenes sp. WGS1538 TaxID=3366811 RepID=UPI00372D73EA
MENQTKVGMNRTGIQMAPVMGPDQIEYARTWPAQPLEGDEDAIAALRGDYIRHAERVGAVPMPVTGRGIATTAVGELMGRRPAVLFDKLGERAAYERSGVRLYQAMIGKVKACEYAEKTALLADLHYIMNEELHHYQLVVRAIKELGGDPTAQTPSADVSAVASMGIIQVLTDPRTTLAHGLQVLLTAEMTDKACWELLVELVREAGQEDMAALFQDALEIEREHEIRVKRWLQVLLSDEGA